MLTDILLRIQQPRNASTCPIRFQVGLTSSFKLDDSSVDVVTKSDSSGISHRGLVQTTTPVFACSRWHCSLFAVDQREVAYVLAFVSSLTRLRFQSKDYCLSQTDNTIYLATRVKMISVAACRRSPRLLSMAPIWQHLLVSHYSVTTATATAVLKPEKGIPAWVNVVLFKSFAAKAQVQKLQEAIGYCFKAEQLLHTAMSLQERDHKPLAYLGDAALLMLFREEAFLIALRDYKPHK